MSQPAQPTITIPLSGGRSIAIKTNDARDVYDALQQILGTPAPQVVPQPPGREHWGDQLPPYQGMRGPQVFWGPVSACYLPTETPPQRVAETPASKQRES